MEYRAKTKVIEFIHGDQNLKYELPSEICSFLGKDTQIESSDAYLLEFDNGTVISLNREYLYKYFEPIEEKDNLNIISDAIDRIEEILDTTYYLNVFKQEINKKIEEIKNALLDLEIEKM